MSQKGERIEQFIDALRSNPDAPVPQGLDAQTAALLRTLVLSRAAETVPYGVQDRVWAKARLAAQLQQASNGRGAHHDDIPSSLSEAQVMEKTDMQYTGTLRVKADPQRHFYPLTLAAALIGLVLFGGALLFMQEPSDPSLSGGMARQTPTIVPSLVPTASVEDNVQPIQMGETVQGTLVGESSSYAFQTEEAMRVLLFAYSEDFLPILTPQIMSSSGGSGEGGGDANALFLSSAYVLELPNDSHVMVTVSSDPNGPASGGNFRLSLLPVPAQPTPNADQSVTADIDEKNPAALFAFAGKAGEQVSVSIKSGDLDAQAWLLDGKGVLLASDDDSGLGSSPELSSVYLAEDGLYIVLVAGKGYMPSGEIAVRLSLDSVDTTSENQVDLENAIPLELGQTVEGELSQEQPTQTYSFTTGDQETRLALFALSHNFLPQFAAGFSTASGGGGGGGDGGGPVELPTTTFTVYTVPANAQGWIQVSAGQGSSDSGRYLFSMQHVPTEPSMAYGETVEGRLDLNQPFIIDTFQGSAGDQVTIMVNAEPSLNVDMMMIDPDNMRIAQDADNGVGTNPEINDMVLPGDGLYTIVVYLTGEDQTGAFELTLESSAP